MARRSGRPGTTRATQALDALGTAYTLHPYEHDPAAPSYGLEAAAVLGLDPAAVHKTLVVEVDGALAVGVVPVSGTLDLKAVARTLGGRAAAMADPRAVERSTGYVLGGVSPLGQRRRLPTVLDAAALDLAVVYVSAGRRGLDLGIAPHDLVAATGAVTATIGRPA